MQQQQMMGQAQIQISDDVARVAHEQKLGMPQGDYKILKLARGWRWHGPIIFTLLSTTIILWSITIVFLIVEGFFTISPNPDMSFDTINNLLAYTLCSTILFVIGIIPFAIIYTNHHFYPCSKGFILKQATKFHTVHWDEVESVWHTYAHAPLSFFGRHRVYKIRCHDGYTLTFSGTRKELANLDKTINEQFTQRQLPIYLANYKAGQAVDFGPLSVNLNGITAHGKTLSWEHITAVSLLKDRRLAIAEAGDEQRLWLSMQSFKIPNISLLLALVEHIRTGQPIQSEQIQPAETSLADGTNTTLVLTARRNIRPLPAKIASLADEHQLGERRVDDQYGISRIATWPAIIGQFIVLIIMLLFTNWLCSWMFSWLTVPYMPGITTIENAVKIGIFLIVGIACSFKIFPWITHVNHHIYIFAHGLIFKRGRNAPVVCRWHDIETIRLAYKSSSEQTTEQTVSAHTLQMRDGAKYTLSSFDIKQAAMLKLTQEQVTPLQLSRSLAAYHEEQTLDFGPLHVNQQGIALDFQQLPWSQVKSARLEGNSLVIYDITQQKTWCKLPAKSIPNLFAFFALTDIIRENI